MASYYTFLCSFVIWAPERCDPVMLLIRFYVWLVVVWNKYKFNHLWLAINLLYTKNAELIFSSKQKN